MAISISAPQSGDSAALGVIGAQLSIWQCFHQAVDLILSFLDVALVSLFYPVTINLDPPSGGPRGLDHRGILGNEIHAYRIASRDTGLYIQWRFPGFCSQHK